MSDASIAVPNMDARSINMIRYALRAQRKKEESSIKRLEAKFGKEAATINHRVKLAIIDETLSILPEAEDETVRSMG